MEVTAKRGSTAPRSPKTTVGYRKKMELYVYPTLGRLRLDQVGVDHLTRLHTWMAAGRVEGTDIVLGKGSGVTERTIGATHGILRAALNDAVRRKELRWNPAGAVDPPAIREPYIAKIITPAQWRQVIDSAKEVSNGALVVLAAAMGLRRGEILALRWDEDVHLDDEFPWLRVSGGLQHVTGEGLVRLRPKNVTSDRSLAIPKVAADLLRAARCDSGYVIGHEDGSPFDPAGAYRRIWGPLRAGLGLGTVRLHDLRHTIITHQHMTNAVPVAVQAAYFGHSLSGTTFKIYTHVTLEDTRLVAQAIDDIYDASR
ncbi:MAG: tyrosine-type recombinase/integrase [Candidatus Dormibacteria bacterium]